MLVIDFGAEMYVWIGKQSPKTDRVTALRQAEELWSQGYNYSAFKINPMSPFLGNLAYCVTGSCATVHVVNLY